MLEKILYVVLNQNSSREIVYFNFMRRVTAIIFSNFDF